MSERRKNPRISVLMSVYNGAEFLQEAIDSILTQTFLGFEFLIIDDGSTDSSVDIVNSYRDERIKLIKNEKNIGLTKSLNRGIGFSRGEFVVRMDADDISAPDRLDKLLDYMISNPDVAVCGSWLETIGARQEVWKCKELDSEIKAQLLFCNAIFHPTVIIRKSCLYENNVFYDEQLRTAQDYGLWVALSGYASFANLQEVLLKYRIHKNKIGEKLPQVQKKDADISRINILKIMGVAADSVDIDFHSQLVNPESGNGQLLKKALRHFYCLVAANKRTGFIKDFCLERLLVEKWWLICHGLSIGTLLPLLGLRKSLLKKLVDMGLIDKTVFFDSCISGCQPS